MPNFRGGKSQKKTGCQFGVQQNSISPLGYVPPQMFHSAFAAFGHSESASATAFPSIVLWRRERVREWQGQAVYHHPLLSPWLAWGRQRGGGGGWGTLGRQHNCEGSSLELRAAQRVIEWSCASGPPEFWIRRVGGLLSPHPFSLSNSLTRSLAPLLSQHLQEKRLAHPLWPALELWCGSQWLIQS